VARLCSEKQPEKCSIGRVSTDFFGESMKGDAATTCISKYVAERYKQEEIITITERAEEIHSG
jgi:hypothetical protein